MPVSSIQEVLSDFSEGKMVVIVDDLFRENEGDIVVAADFITPEVINFMVTHGRGSVCVPLSGELCDHLDFYPMVPTAPLGWTAFTVTVDASDDVTTGVSVRDRCVTISKMVDPGAVPEDFRRPGHVFPLRACDGGVLVRSGHTEASVDLCRVSGLSRAAVICEILNDDGSMARLPDLERFSLRHDLKIGLIEELVDYRLNHEEVFSFSDEFHLYDDVFVRRYCDSVDGCSWCLVYHKDSANDLRGNVLSIDRDFLGDIVDVKAPSKAIAGRTGDLALKKGMVGFFRLVAGTSGMIFKDLFAMSSLQVMFKRTKAALAFVADDISSPLELSFDDWKECFRL